MLRTYRYVGPKSIAGRSSMLPLGAVINSAHDVIRWIRQNGSQRGTLARLTATFVVDEQGRLRLADRHSEHVACAGGKPIQAAGEMTFLLHPAQLFVEEVTNQSTGYCPEPDSWQAVAQALSGAGISGPAGYTTEFQFRRCPGCAAINVVKDQVFECTICGAGLPEAWNCDSEAEG